MKPVFAEQLLRSEAMTGLGGLLFTNSRSTLCSLSVMRQVRTPHCARHLGSHRYSSGSGQRSFIKVEGAIWEAAYARTGLRKYSSNASDLTMFQGIAPSEWVPIHLEPLARHSSHNIICEMSFVESEHQLCRGAILIRAKNHDNMPCYMRVSS